MIMHFVIPTSNHYLFQAKQGVMFNFSCRVGSGSELFEQLALNGVGRLIAASFEAIGAMLVHLL